MTLETNHEPEFRYLSVILVGLLSLVGGIVVGTSAVPVAGEPPMAWAIGTLVGILTAAVLLVIGLLFVGGLSVSRSLSR